MVFARGCPDGGGWRMTTIIHVLGAIVIGDHVAQHILAAVSIVCCIGVFFVQKKRAEQLLGIAFSAGLLLPIYLVIYILWRERTYLSDLWGVGRIIIISVLMFSPTSIVLTIGLYLLKEIQHYKVWAAAAIFSTLISWAGIAVFFLFLRIPG
jgi:hypothetical protein